MAAGTQHLPLGTRQKFWQLEKRGHDFVILLTTKNGFKTIFLPKALPHSDKVRFDFFHLEKTYIQDTHTPTREEGRQVNVFSDHAADFTSIKRFNTAQLGKRGHDFESFC